MRLERTLLENVCQHRYLEHTWQPGLNGILGPNGSGKSNIIKATRFAVTGVFDNAGTKAENICQLAGDKDRSRVVLDFEHEGLKVEIVRVLRRGTSHCRIDGGEQIDGDNAVTEAVMDVLGVDQRILSEYVFVPQRRMAGFVDETPGERNKTFGQLFDLARADTIYRLMDAEIKRTNPAARSPEIDPLKERVGRNRARHAALLAAMDASRGRLWKIETKAARDLIARAERWDRDNATVGSYEGQVDKLSGDLEARQRELREAETLLAELVEARDDAAQDITAAREALARWDIIRARLEWRDALQARQRALDNDPAAHPEPQLPAGFPGKAAANAKAAELDHAVRVRRDLLKLFKDRPKVCPTCGTETDAILAKAAAYEAELPGMERDLAEARLVQEAYLLYKRSHDQWRYWHDEHVARREALVGEWQKLADGVEEAAGVDHVACRDVLDAGASLDTAVAETTVQVSQLRKEVARWAGLRDDADGKLARLRGEMGDRPDPGAEELARTNLGLAEELERSALRDGGELTAVTASLADDEALLRRLEAAEARAAADRLWAYHLGEIRKVMHHDRLPKVVAHNYLEILADDTNELLESFDTDFRVDLGDGLNFMATFLRGQYAGAVSPAQRLSEGQKVLLALAFRVAVNSLFAGTAGLLCLDEPTESLDERNLACLEVAIGKMRDLSESRGMQCLLVTHEPSFEVLFDGVLRLAA